MYDVSPSFLLCVFPYFWLLLDKTLPQPLLNREFERHPGHSIMVAKDSFKLSFLLQVLRIKCHLFIRIAKNVQNGFDSFRRKYKPNPQH